MFKLLPFAPVAFLRTTWPWVLGLIVSYFLCAAAAADTLDVAFVLGRMLPPPCCIGPPPVCYCGILVPLRIKFEMLIGPVAFIC